MKIRNKINSSHYVCMQLTSLVLTYICLKNKKKARKYDRREMTKYETYFYKAYYFPCCKINSKLLLVFF